MAMAQLMLLMLLIPVPPLLMWMQSMTCMPEVMLLRLLESFVLKIRAKGIGGYGVVPRFGFVGCEMQCWEREGRRRA
jgi:hypothetical protein